MASDRGAERARPRRRPEAVLGGPRGRGNEGIARAAAASPDITGQLEGQSFVTSADFFEAFSKSTFASFAASTLEYVPMRTR